MEELEMNVKFDLANTYACQEPFFLQYAENAKCSMQK